MNIIDYINWRGDLTFDEREINEVDNLIFSELSYIDYGNLLADVKSEATLAELYTYFVENGIESKSVVNDPMQVLKAAAESERFSNVRIKWYFNDVDAERQVQFSAVTYLYHKDDAYVAFRGTDNTIVGWREDMNMTYLSETEGQAMAVDYLNKIAPKISGKLFVGGHSKGGNFAVYASAFCTAIVQAKITKVYSNDGPGFLDSVLKSDGYKAVVPKIVKFIPESSLVGILLSDRERHKYIKSSGKGLANQHDPSTWSVNVTRFELCEELSPTTVFIADTLKRWLDSQTDDSKRVFVEAVFGVLEKAGITSVDELMKSKLTTYRDVLKAMGNIAPENQKTLQESLKMLFKSGTEIAFSGSQKQQKTAKPQIPTLPQLTKKAQLPPKSQLR